MVLIYELSHTNLRHLYSTGASVGVIEKRIDYFGIVRQCIARETIPRNSPVQSHPQAKPVSGHIEYMQSQKAVLGIIVIVYFIC